MYYIFACKNKTMSLLVCVENALCKVSRFKEGKAEYHGVGCYTEMALCRWYFWLSVDSQLPVFETEKSEFGKGCTAMLRKLNCFFNIVIGSFIGVFIGFGIYKFWHFKTYSNLYVMQSAPWYTELLLDDAMVAVVVVVCIVLKLVIWRKLKP